MKYYLVLLLLTLVGCKEAEGPTASASSVNCKGTYYTRSSSTGELRKFNEYYLSGIGACVTDSVALSQWEKTNDSWERRAVACTPQSGFTSRALVSANNYYDYRDGRIYLDFDSSNGVYRKIVLGEDQEGQPTFTRTRGCFYQRTGTGVDIAYGKQLLLDTDVNKWASSEVFEPMEIFKYDENATAVNMTRFDSSLDWDFRFCPYLSSPWKFCELLRDGNEMFFPILTAQEQTDLLNEALLISKQFNYITIATSEFGDLWENVATSRTEQGRVDWKFQVIHNVDTPQFLDGNWRSYLMGDRPTMPNVTSPTLPPVCYDGVQTVVLANGQTAEINGEICYTPGSGYSFTPE